MRDTKPQEKWRRELERRGADNVRAALIKRGAIPDVDHEFAKEWLFDHDRRLIRRLLVWARVRTAMLLVAAIAGVIVAIDVILSWLG